MRDPVTKPPAKKPAPKKPRDAETRREDRRAGGVNPGYNDTSGAPGTQGAQGVGDWTKVILGGYGMNQTSAFWSKSKIRSGPHTGVDLSAPRGTPAHMPVGGTVVRAGYDGAFGNTVLVQMPDGNYLMFSHLDSINVSKGQKIEPGQMVGRVGSTGNSTGNHLHVEVRTKASKGSFGNRESWRFADPIKYLNSNGTATSPIGADGGGSAGGGGGGGSFGGGGGGGGGSYGFSKKDMYDKLTTMFGDLDTLLKLDAELVGKGEGKSIKWLIDTLTKKRIVDPAIAATYMAQTGFFKKYSTDIAEKLILERQRPGVAGAEIDKRVADITASMNAAGIVLPEAKIRELARNSWAYNWNDQQIAAQVAASPDVVLSGGAWDEAVADLAQYADEYGVTYSDALHNQFKADYLGGKGDEGIRTAMREQAASKYAVFADRINAGESVKAITSAYWDLAANLLEDPDAVSWEDPLFRNGRAFTTVDAQSGQMRAKTLDEFEKEIRADARWRKTKNARDEMTGIGYDILQRFGMVG